MIHLIKYNNNHTQSQCILFVPFKEINGSIISQCFLIFNKRLIVFRFMISILLTQMMMMMIDVLRPLLCTCQAKWAERPPKVTRRSERRNNLQICPRRDSNTGGSDLWSSTLPLDHGGALFLTQGHNINNHRSITTTVKC